MSQSSIVVRIDVMKALQRSQAGMCPCAPFPSMRLVISIYSHGSPNMDLSNACLVNRAIGVPLVCYGMARYHFQEPSHRQDLAVHDCLQRQWEIRNRRRSRLFRIRVSGDHCAIRHGRPTYDGSCGDAWSLTWLLRMATEARPNATILSLCSQKKSVSVKPVEVMLYSERLFIKSPP